MVRQLTTPYIRFMLAARDREVYEITISYAETDSVYEKKREMLAWCEDSCQGAFLLYNVTAMFVDPGDAAMFKLTWG